MSMTASLTMPPSGQPTFLQFGAWSVFLHLGILALMSMSPGINKIEEAPPVVHVTLIETPAVEKTQEDAPANAPPLMPARRPVDSRERTIPPSPVPSSVPSPPVTIAQVAPPPPTPDTLTPLARQTLRDHHATDALALKGYLKTAQRPTTQPVTSTPERPSLDMPALPSTMVAGIPSPAAAQPNLPPTLPGSEQSAVLTATPSGTTGISRSKAGLARTDPPVYPRIARESGWEGTVLVRVVIQVDGTPDSVHVRKSSGHQILDDAAIEAVKHWRFTPARDGNIPIRSIVEIPINFNLREQG